jgi:hypothetical protein
MEQRHEVKISIKHLSLWLSIHSLCKLVQDCQIPSKFGQLKERTPSGN